MTPIEPVDDVDPTNPHSNPVVQALIPLDVEHLELDHECQRKVVAIQMEYEAKQLELHDRRQVLLERSTTGEDTEEPVGTPALPKFWLTCFQNHPEVSDIVEKWDEPVLTYLRNVLCEDLPDDSGLNMAGFRLIFVFSPNPYFENERLIKEYHTVESSAWMQDLEVTEITLVEEIKWKSGKDVTSELKKKKKKKKGPKAGASVMEKVPRPSFFRIFFRTLKADDEAPEDLVAFHRSLDDEEDDSDDEEEDMMENIMDDDYEKGISFRDTIVPYAVRWYTGEACPGMDEDEEEEDDDADGSSEEESDANARPNLFATDNTQSGAEGGKEPECKQQ